MLLNKDSKKHVLAIAGPTAVGKTSFAIQLAQQLQTEIISADSRQLYTELNIGVARPSTVELNSVKHHFVASASILEEYNAGTYAEECNAILNRLFKKHDVIVLTGGTGLYIKSALQGLDPRPKRNEALRKELDQLFLEKGIEGLQQRYLSLNANSEIDLNNPQRLIRAIEIELSELPLQKPIQRDYTPHFFFLNRPRPELYERINLRVDQMIEQGLENEVHSLISNKHLNALQTVGYSEFFNYFDGKTSRDFAIDKIKQHTRNYAKRQLTWFRNQGYQEIDANVDPQKSINDLLSRLQ